MSAYSDRVLAAAPDAYWRLLETSGSTAVDEIGAVNATYAGDYQQSHVLGAVRGGSYCTYFNGGTAGAAVGSTSVGAYGVSQAFTIEFWLDQWYISNIIKRYDGTRGWQIRGNGTSSPVFYLYAQGAYGLKSFTIPASTPGAPRHFAFVYDGTVALSGMRLFHDGVELAQSSNSWNLTGAHDIVATTPVTMFGDGGVGCFMECAIYSRALSLEEITEHANPGLAFSGRYDEGAQILRSVSRPAKNLITTTAGSSVAAKGGGRLNPRIG